MAVTAETHLTLSELQRLLTAADPAALLIKPRLLRRVIRRHGGAAGFGLLLPHAHSYVIDRASLLALVGRDELGLAPDQPLPPTVILLPKPEADDLAAAAPGAVLVRYWRGLFHARVHIALDQRTADGKLTDADIRNRIERLRETEFDEIQTVLRQEKALLPPEDDRTVYTEFVALALELRSFDPAGLHLYFPAIADWKAVDALLAEEVDAEALFAATRPQGAPDPATTHAEDEDEEESATSPPAVASGLVSPREPHREADETAARGNLVRAALLHARAVPQTAGPEAREAAARPELDRLTERLRHALSLSEANAAALRRALPPLLARASEGGWSVEARLLYDLQKACVDQERGIFGLHLLGWAFSLGRNPLKRPRPGEQAVLVFRHVRAAARKAARTRLAGAERRRLVSVLSAVLSESAEHLRNHFRPLLAGCLEAVGLTPANLPERVARDKLIDELLDRIEGKGFLTLGDVRDAISRNQLKLPDLAGPGEWVRGDPLLRLNRALAGALDGAYRPGEVYLRALQRVSALGFGTALGRLLALFVLLPFGVAFVALRGLDLLAEEGDHLLGWLGLHTYPFREGLASLAELDGHVHHEHYHPTHLASPWSIAALGVFLLLLINVAGFRQKVFLGLRALGRGFRTVLIDGPAWLIHHPVVRAVLTSRPVTFFRRHLLAPLLLAGATAGLLTLFGADAPTTASASGAVFVLTLAFLASRFGRDVQEIAVDRFVRFWQRVTTDFLPGLFRWVMLLSRRLLEGIDRLLYTVDEWLRFRQGESRLALVFKGLAVMVWGAFAYIVRIYTNLLVEPTVNPIKHFPVVTVGHKLMLPFLVPLFRFLEAQLSFLGPVLASGLVGVTIFFLPGIFGFMVWEFKENWKLYRANRPETLRPVLIGSHGETMLRLLRPGFHSGTIPKLFAKLRRAERRGSERGARRYHEGLHHAEESLHHFVEREFLHLLAHSKSWGGLRLELQEIELATNRVRLELACPELAAETVSVRFDHRAGWLVAGVRGPGWLPRLTEGQRQALATALAGLYKLAGVDLTREQIADSLAPAKLPYRITLSGLEVCPGADGSWQAVYPLGDGAVLRPVAAGGGQVASLPVLERNRLLFRETPIRWAEWVEAWQRDQAGQGVGPVPAAQRVLGW
jgi:hypothetical protein